ncbi:MAG: hypothetical protein ACRDE2_00290 [Chitinophagaceae bacterium]
MENEITEYKVDNVTWTLDRKILTALKVIEEWSSNYLCEDNDTVLLYLYDDKLRLYCFSGIECSYICFNKHDLAYLSEKVNISNASSTKEKFIIIADYLCKIFCKYKE